MQRAGGTEEDPERDTEPDWELFDAAVLLGEDCADELTDGVTEGVTDGPAPAAVLLPPDVAVLTVRTMRTSSRTTEPNTNSRRRQYTEGGWDPTGRNMTSSR
jgi:hypothetical protein